MFDFQFFKNEKLKWAFLRGYFEGDGCIRKIDNTHHVPECQIASNSHEMLNDIKNNTGIICNINYDHNSISWCGVNALEFLKKIYENASFKMQRKYNSYLKWIGWKPTIDKKRFGRIFFCRTDKDAEFPFKYNDKNDSGFCLNLIKKIKTVANVDFYDTGIKVNPPVGYYFDIIPQRSILQSGYILANDVKIIDRSNVGNIIIPLTRISSENLNHKYSDLMVCLIPRKIE